MNMSKFVDKIDKLLDDYTEKESIDVLESMTELIDAEIDKQVDDQSGACQPEQQDLS